MSEPETGKHYLEKKSILISDLRGFTHFSEKYPALEVINFLNRYLNVMLPIIEKHHGKIDKLLGDSILAVFDFDDGRVVNVLACAIEMQNAMHSINAENRKLGLDSIYMGIGINTGEVALGHLGNDSHREFTVVGNEVNIASRVESFSMRGQVLISDNTYDSCKDHILVGNSYEVQPKGSVRSLKIYELLRLNTPVSLELKTYNLRKEPRVKVTIPVYFKVLEKKKILPEVHIGQSIDLSYSGLLFESGLKLNPFTEIILEVKSSIFGNSVGSAYGKINRVERVENKYHYGIEYTDIDDLAMSAIKAFVDDSI